MGRNRIFLALAGLLVGTLATGAARAAPTTFAGSYSVTANSGTDGLTINTAKVLADPFSFGLSLGQSKSFNLFNIWTPESTLNSDDLVAQPISVNFAFTQPAPPFGGTGDGQTVGAFTGFLSLFQQGKLTWDDGGVFDLNYGVNHDGLIEIALSDATFNTGFLGLDGGRADGATVRAKFTLERLASVPEPASMALLATSVLGLAFVRRRRS